MDAVKRVARSRAAETVAAWLAAQLIRLVRLTGRWRIHGSEPLAERLARDEPVIGCFWHGRLMMMPYLWPRGPRVSVLISHHRDGRLIARAMRHLGIGTVAGSSSRGALSATRQMLSLLQAGESVAITPDGPRGPCMRVAPGVIRLAALSGAPILPAAYSCRRRRMLSSWDRFIIPLPFSQGVYVIGEPLTVPGDADEATLEQARGELEDRLNTITAEADRLTGHTPIAPPMAEAAP